MTAKRAPWFKKIPNLLVLSLPLQWLLIQWLSRNPEWVERNYSQGIYLIFSGFFRWLYGWIPFSIGDVIYIFLLAYSTYLLITRWRGIRLHWKSYLRNIIAAFAVIHFTFYLLWGLNYFRQPLGDRLGLKKEYSQGELLAMTHYLTEKVNRQQESLPADSQKLLFEPYEKAVIFDQTLDGYGRIADSVPALAYNRHSLKTSLISTPLTYMGYGGYLNPFTGEAQVNARLPLFRFPVVSAHEIGHQLGYSAENETNFIGYLVTRQQEDPLLQYTAEAYALSYCLSEINRRDSVLAKQWVNRLNPGVRAHYAKQRTFWEAFENPLEPVFKAIFNSYLKANKQQDGIRSYNRVVGLIIAYHRQQGLLPQIPEPTPED
ncbi:Protein of unknown function [Robiginitalea myxolifaciens]|uniref:DUF3810 domain-containing protein n=1 Tax=Robiginitalea myxolifaciens TaxID=400055 RepID=A0A1I6FNB7_9FLAO|nr:DUF3810 domain-containing protein [Robiginitalea myxolifaciens]SFR31453.1 Protein of unknown function [Robiginitalea myxolifaciens]